MSGYYGRMFGDLITVWILLFLFVFLLWVAWKLLGYVAKCEEKKKKRRMHRRI